MKRNSTLSTYGYISAMMQLSTDWTRTDHQAHQLSLLLHHKAVALKKSFLKVQNEACYPFHFTLHVPSDFMLKVSCLRKYITLSISHSVDNQPHAVTTGSATPRCCTSEYRPAAWSRTRCGRKRSYVWPSQVAWTISTRLW